MARRLIERGTRFVQVMHAGWDQHRSVTTELYTQCKDTDQPSAGLLRDLKQRGLLDDTLIILASDHGEMLGDHGLFTKSVAYDPSMRVPLIVSGPGIEGGQVSDTMVELIDVNATICDLTGLNPQEGVDARSFAPVLHGEGEYHRDNILSSLRHFQCVRTREWKFISNVNDITELYDMQNDPEELQNVAADRREVAREMSQLMNQRWLEGQWRSRLFRPRTCARSWHSGAALAFHPRTTRTICSRPGGSG